MLLKLRSYFLESETDILINLLFIDIKRMELYYLTHNLLFLDIDKIQVSLVVVMNFSFSSSLDAPLI